MIAPRHPSTLVELSRDECLSLLDATAVGRVVVLTSAGTPLIRPVNYVFDAASQSVVFRCHEGTKLAALVRASRAWFEVDEVDPASHHGWSVIVAGVTEPVTGPTELRRLEGIALERWIDEPRAQWIRIRARVVSGRRIETSVASTGRGA